MNGIITIELENGQRYVGKVSLSEDGNQKVGSTLITAEGQLPVEDATKRSVVGIVTSEDLSAMEKRLSVLGKETSGRRVALEIADFYTTYKGLESFSLEDFQKMYVQLMRAGILGEKSIVTNYRQLLLDTKNKSGWLDVMGKKYCISAVGYRELAKSRVTTSVVKE